VHYIDVVWEDCIDAGFRFRRAILQEVHGDEDANVTSIFHPGLFDRP
jgi:hypothetical protein